MLERLAAEYPKKTRVGFNIHPSPSLAYSAVEPYNAVLATHSALEHSDVNFVLEN